MDFQYSKTKKIIPTASIALQSVYHVQADATYDIHKQWRNNTKELVALRTLQGTGVVVMENNKVMTLGAHTLLLVEHNKVRRYYCYKEQWDFWWFTFQIGGMLHLPLNTILSINPFHEESVQFNQCLECLRKDNISAKVLASATLGALFYQWMAKVDEQRDTPHAYQETIEQIIQYIHNHLGDTITVKKLAHMAGLSERQFRQVFKAITGKSPKKYYDELRLNMSAELLTNTSLSIGEIAIKLAYSSPFHFSKAFKQYFGLFPSNYRKRMS